MGECKQQFDQGYSDYFDLGAVDPATGEALFAAMHNETSNFDIINCFPDNAEAHDVAGLIDSAQRSLAPDVEEATGAVFNAYQVFANNAPPELKQALAGVDLMDAGAFENVDGIRSAAEIIHEIDPGASIEFDMLGVAAKMQEIQETNVAYASLISLQQGLEDAGLSPEAIASIFEIGPDINAPEVPQVAPDELKFP